MGSIPVDPSGKLEAMDLSNVLIVYGNWRNRFVSARPRTVHVSRELATELPGSPHAHGVTNVSRKIEAGENLDAHLSTGVGVVYVPQAERAAKRHRARDLDAMLAERGLHHLHLGADEGSRFVARTTELLFVAFRDDDAYLVGTVPHGTWARREVLERMVRNWPGAELLMQAPGVIGLEQDYSDEDRLKLMLGGVSTAIEIDGSVYMGLGQTTAGHANAGDDARQRAHVGADVPARARRRGSRAKSRRQPVAVLDARRAGRALRTPQFAGFPRPGAPFLSLQRPFHH